MSFDCCILLCKPPPKQVKEHFDHHGKLLCTPFLSVPHNISSLPVTTDLNSSPQMSFPVFTLRMNGLIQYISCVCLASLAQHSGFGIHPVVCTVIFPFCPCVDMPHFVHSAAAEPATDIPVPCGLVFISRGQLRRIAISASQTS